MNNPVYIFNLPANIPFRLCLIRISEIQKHWHPEAELLLMLSGRVHAEVQGTVSHMEAGDILLINGNNIHSLKGAESALLLSMTLDLHKFDLPGGEAECLFFLCDSANDENPRRYDNLRSLMALVVERSTALTQDASARYDYKSFAYSILKELTQEFQAEPPAGSLSQGKYLNRMDEIVRYIDAHYRENLSLSSLAEAVHLSAPYLSSLFSRYLDTTFSDYYNDIRLGHAVDDLLATDDAIGTIALNHGFANTQSFTRAFKSKYRTLPSEYRKTYRGSYGTGKDRRTDYLNLNAVPEGFDLSLLVRYLPHRESGGAVRQDRPPITAQADRDHIIGQISDSWRTLIGIGSAKEILYREVQEQLIEIRQEIGFEYIKFHGLLSDEMMVVTRSYSGALTFNFHTVDMVFDFLFSIGFKPFLQLSFMPIELAKDRQKIIFNGKYNTSQPAYLNEWLDLIRAFFRHIIDRYGMQTVRQLPVTLWNNADSSVDMFGMQDDLSFFRMYRETWLAVKELCPDIRFGAPAMTFMHEDSIAWARRFYRWEMDHGVVPDFISAQYYSVIWQPHQLKIDLQSWRPDHLVPSDSGGSDLPLLAGIPMSPDPDHLADFQAFLEEFKRDLGLGRLPVWITEWNISVSHSNLINDTLFSGCYIIKNVLEHSSGLSCMGYWSATDFIEEQPLADETFHGGLGLMTMNGIRKPSFLAFQTLRQLEQDILAQGNGYIVTCGENRITILLYNYEHFSGIFAGNKSLNVNATTRYTPFAEQMRAPFRIRLSGLPDRPIADAAEFIVNRDHGCAYDEWVRMGAPGFGKSSVLDEYRLRCLRSGAHPLIRTIHPCIRSGVLEYEAVLEPLEFRLIAIEYEPVGPAASAGTR